MRLFSVPSNSQDVWPIRGIQKRADAFPYKFRRICYFSLHSKEIVGEEVAKLRNYSFLFVCFLKKKTFIYQEKTISNCIV